MSITDDVNRLAQQVAELSNEIAMLGDVHAIRKLQHAYGYYLDKCLYDEVVDLFADTGEVRFMGGAFKGRAGLRRLYCGRFRERFTGGHNGPIHGFLLEHLQLQDIVDVAPDRKTACGRFRYFMQAGSHESRQAPVAGMPLQWWEGGLYENEFVRENGVWKFQLVNNQAVYHGLYDKGWRHTPAKFVPFFATVYPADPTGPDELIEPKAALWPDTDVLAFHYVHPVTGKRWSPVPA